MSRVNAYAARPGHLTQVGLRTWLADHAPPATHAHPRDVVSDAG